MAQQDLSGGLPMVSDPYNGSSALIDWLNKWGFAPDTNINKDPNTGIVTKNGVPYTPTAEELKILNTKPTLFPGFQSITNNITGNLTSAIVGIGILALVLVMFKK
jgi:hypothetical protein